MCLIIFSPNIAKATIRKTVLERGFNKNDDGAGIAYMQDGQLRVSKGYKDFDTFYKAYEKIKESLKNGPLLIHFRWATCGDKNYSNTQPLNINSGSLVMAHNGVFSSLSDKKSEHSDSVILANLIRRMKWEFPFSAPQVEFLQAFCDDSSKLVFINNKGQYIIINEKLGAWRDGSWYSDKAKVFETDNVYRTPTNIPGGYNEGGYGSGYGHYNDNKRVYTPTCFREPKKNFGGDIVKPAGGIFKKPSIIGKKTYAEMNKEERLAYDIYVERVTEEESKLAIKEARKAQESVDDSVYNTRFYLE